MSLEEVPNLTAVVADIGATYVRVALSRGSSLGPIRQQRAAALQDGGDDGVLIGLVGLMREAIAAGFDGEPAQAAAAGIGVCAAVDDGGSLQPPLPSGIPGGRRIANVVGAALGVPVAVDNDANMAALGELRHGAGRGLRDFVLITLGTNIGMGLVAGGRVLRGAHGGAGEGGLFLVPAQSAGPPSNESRGRLVDVGRFGAHPSQAPDGYAWVEELVGGGALARALSERRGAASARAARPEAPLRVLAEAAAGDRDALTVVDRAIEGWAYVIANSIALFDPAAIILSGGLAEEIGPLLERLRRRAAALSRAEPLVVKAELGANGGLIGASAAALDLLNAPVGEQATPHPLQSAGNEIGTTPAWPRPTHALDAADRRTDAGSNEMAREIRQTPEAVRQTLAELQRGPSRRGLDLAGRGRVILLGTGASLAMARCAAALWTRAGPSRGAARRIVVWEAAEALFAESRPLAEPGVAVVVVSKSGKSPESLEAAEASRRAGNRVIAITSDGASPLASAASDVVLTPIGEERGAATKSETAALAALLALAGLIPNDPGAADRIVALLYDVTADESLAAAGSAAGGARRLWTAGFGASGAVAEALALLLHEKGRIPAIAGSPSGFRHGLVEASAAGDALVVIEARDEQPPLSAYFDRLAIEGQRVGFKIAWIAGRDRAGLNVRLRGSTEVERTLEALVRAQQLAYAAARAAGTYIDGFRVLGTLVRTKQPFA